MGNAIIAFLSNLDEFPPKIQGDIFPISRHSGGKFQYIFTYLGPGVRNIPIVSLRNR